MPYCRATGETVLAGLRSERARQNGLSLRGYNGGAFCSPVITSILCTGHSLNSSMPALFTGEVSVLNGAITNGAITLTR